MLNFSRNKLIASNKNVLKNLMKFPMKNFYFQETSHGAGEVILKFNKKPFKYFTIIMYPNKIFIFFLNKNLFIFSLI